MNKEKIKKNEKLIKKSFLNSDSYAQDAKEIDNEVKNILNEEQWRLYKVLVSGAEEDEEKLIEEFGKEKYLSIYDGMFNKVINYFNKKLM